jgi:hypothetical protein
MDANSLGVIDIRPPVNDATLYAATTLDSAAAGPVVFLVGSKDSFALWVNGEKVAERKESKNWALTGERVVSRLKKGSNHILVRCDNRQGNWAFSVRFSRDKVEK